MTDNPTRPLNRRQRLVADAWRGHALPLADWACAHLVNRQDYYGSQYVDDDGSVRRITRRGLVRDHVVGHFEAGPDARPDAMIGVHVAAPDATCKWLAIDIDKHGDESIEDNTRFALHALGRARQAGIDAALTDSSGGLGGYHLWVLSERPLPMADARRLVTWLVDGWEDFGLPKRPDLFPGNDRLTGKGCSTWLRLPGRHHKRPSWSRVWSPGSDAWLDGEDAVAALLALRGRPVDVAAIVPEDFGRAAPKGQPARTRRSERPSPGRRPAPTCRATGPTSSATWPWRGTRCGSRPTSTCTTTTGWRS